MMFVLKRSRSGYLFLWMWVCVVLNTGLFSQAAKLELKAARNYYKKENYKQASINYQAAWDAIAKDQDLLFEAGNCHFEANKLSEAIRCFEQLRELNSSYQNLQWLLAKTYHANHEFYKAIKAYKQALKETDRNGDRAAWIRNELLRCSSGSQYMRREPLALVESLGKDINSEEDEYAACPSINFDGKYYFSARRALSINKLTNVSNGKKTKQADLYWTRQENGIWMLPQKMHSELNSKLDEEVLSACDHGNVMIFSRGFSEDRYQIYTDTFHQEAASIHYESLKYPMIAEIGDRALSIFQDSMMIFSSSRSGGYGAYDLYLSVKRDGKWLEAINLGPEINGPFNEDYPFLAKDGQTLFFSSDRLESMGGYDIFKIKYLPESNKWSIAYNLGYPVNSSGNDTHFKLTEDALAAVLSSDRKVNNFGKRDIYLVYFKEALEEQMYASQGSPLSILINPEKDISEIPEVRIPLESKQEIRSTYFLEPIFYQDDYFLKEARNQKITESLIHLLKSHPNLQVHISGHAYEESLDPVNLYFSIKKAENLRDYLQDKGIEADRIHCYGLGASLPMAKPTLNETISPASSKLNKRLDLKITNEDTSKISIQYKSISVHPLLQPEAKSNSFSHSKTLHYALYLGDASSISNHPLIDDSKGFVFVEKIAQAELYSYYFGTYQRFEDAETAQKDFEALGFPIKSIRARLNDTWLDRKELIDHVLEFPDLLLYLDFLNTENEEKK
ncbi:MAG: PD40 domain-containing protein [Saprospiraceae bacterium]|nr:PD40 domain-containing protein [Saprospiraceae bacterium]